MANNSLKSNGPPASLNISAISNKREPPASLGGTIGGASQGANKSMDLGQIMAQINQSPAPASMRRKPTTKNAAQIYLAKKPAANEDNCAIF